LIAALAAAFVLLVVLVIVPAVTGSLVDDDPEQKVRTITVTE
jgi:hypothetical protein